jgi:hypothetical protein
MKPTKPNFYEWIREGDKFAADNKLGWSLCNTLSTKPLTVRERDFVASLMRQILATIRVHTLAQASGVVERHLVEVSTGGEMSIEKRLHELFPDMDPNDVRLRTLGRMWNGDIRCFRTSPSSVAIRYVLAEEADAFLKEYPEAIEIPAQIYEFMMYAKMFLVQQENGEWRR